MHAQPGPVLGGRRDLSRLVAGAMALVAYLAFFGLARTQTGTELQIAGGLSNSSAGELQFWLGAVFLLLPAAGLLGYALADTLGPVLESWWQRWRRFEELTRTERIAACLALAAVLWVVFRLLHRLVLLDYPVTDDEYGARFGGQVLASGRLWIPVPPSFEHWPKLYLYVKDGMVTSMEWLGLQSAWAVAEWTGLGAALFSLAAAAAGVFLVAAVHTQLGGRWALVAGALFLASPMAVALSSTTHAHLLSRAGVAAAIYCLCRAHAGANWGWAAGALAAALAFSARPFEVAFLLTPVFLVSLLAPVRESLRRGLLFAAGAAVPLVAMGLHHLVLTGSMLLAPRHAPGAICIFLPKADLWHRFATNSGFSLFLLAIWVLGPLGILLVGLGIRASRLTSALAAGVALALVLACFHDSTGIHIVGPIHYSEAVIPLLFIAVHGLVRLVAWLQRVGVPARRIAVHALCWIVVAQGTFIAWHARGLHRQAMVQSTLYGFIESQVALHSGGGSAPALVLAPQFGASWSRTPGRAVGSWVFEWRRPRPDLSDPILILEPGTREVTPAPDPEQWAAKVADLFPERRPFVFYTLEKPPYLFLAPLSSSPAPAP